MCKTTIRNYSYLFILLTFICCSPTKNITEDNNTPSEPIIPLYKMIELDKLGQLYAIDKQNNITLFKGDKITKWYEYSNNRLGNISTVDVSNPQKILVFYRDFQTIVLLDNTLTEVKRLNLLDMGHTDIHAACSSIDNGIWIADMDGAQLLKISQNGTLVIEGYNFRDENWGSFSTLKLREKGGSVFMGTDMPAVLQFDNFGAFIFRHDIGWQNEFTISNEGEIYYYDQTGISAYNTKLKARYQLEGMIETFEGVSDFGIKGLEYYLLRAGEVVMGKM